MMHGHRASAIALCLLACSSRGATPTTTTSSADRATAPAPRPPVLRLPAGVVPRRQSVDLTILPSVDTFTGAVAIDVELAAPTSVLWLNAKQITMSAAEIESAGITHPATRLPTSNNEFLGLALDQPVGPGPAVVRIRYTGTFVDDDYVGLFRQRENGAPYVFSQFQIADARRAFPCFDEPQFKIPWQLTLRVAKQDVGLANSPVARESAGPGEEMKTIEFQPTQPLPSYLVAVAVGPFDMVDGGVAGRNRVPIRFAVPRGRSREAREARRSTRDYLVALERYFALPYPYEKLDSVAVPHLFGAMENVALVTYAANILLAMPEVEKTPDFQLVHRETVAHEIAHQWFGNLVTLEWWDDLWLNESFATWLEGKLTGRESVQGAATDDVESMDSVTGRQGAMRADSLASARAIHQPITSQDDFLFLFDPINYGKGGAVIAMFERYVGEERFRDGVRAYIRKHAHGNATSADFLAALDAAAPGRDVAAAFTSFLGQPGVPLVSIDLRCQEGAPPALELRQERLLSGHPNPPAQRWKIPVCVEYGTGRGKRDQCTLLDEPSETLALEAKSCPTWVNGNAGGAGYYRVAYGGELLARILDGRTPLGARERAAALDDAVALADAGRLSYSVLIAALPSLARERSYAVLRRAVHLARAMQDLVPPEGRDAYAGMVRALFGARARSLGWKPRSREPAGARLLRPDLMSLVAIQGADEALAAGAERAARAWLRDPSTLPPDAQAAVLGTAAATRGTAPLYDAYRARLDQEKSLERRRPILIGLARFRDPALIARTVELAASSGIQFNEMTDLLSGGASDPDRAEAIYRQVVQRFAALSAKLGRDRKVELLAVGGALCSDRLRAEADRFFADKLAGEPGIAIARGKMRETIELCAARRAAQAAAVRKALQGT